MLAGVSCRTTENPLSWRDIVPLPPFFHYSDESAAGVEKGGKVRFIVLEDVKGQTVTIFVSRRTAAVGKGIPAVPEHYAEEDHQVPVMLDQGIELSMAA